MYIANGTVEKQDHLLDYFLLFLVDMDVSEELINFLP